MRTHSVLYGTLILCASMLASCGTTYKYVQVCTAKSIDNATTAQSTNEGLLYENEDCIVKYNLWSNGGDAGFVFYNKTNKVIHIDLSQTFLMKNGVAYDYYTPQTVTKTSSSSVGVATSATYAESYSAAGHAAVGAKAGAAATNGSVTIGASKSAAVDASWGAAIFGSLTATNTANYGISTSVATTEQPILSIPPKSSKAVSGYAISKGLLFDCDLNKYPANSAKLTFDADNSPLTFANYITYSVGEEQEDKVIENKFYIAEVANYAEPYILKYTERAKTCDNVLSPEEKQQQKNAPQVYDAYINVTGENNFYTTYSIYSTTKLYTEPKGGKGKQWYYNYKYKGYLAY